LIFQKIFGVHWMNSKLLLEWSFILTTVVKLIIFSHTSDHIQNRPNYYVPIDMESIKPDPERPKIHFNANETYFYNTLPTRKATFFVNNNFISENLCIPKKNSYEEKIRILNSQGKPVRFRRDYAFVYWIMALVSWTREKIKMKWISNFSKLS